MTFTFTSDLTDSGDYVRFHTGDTTSPGFMSDELITSLLATSSSANAAVIAGIRYIITQLARPNFKADWLTVDSTAALKYYRDEVLPGKLNEFGIAGRTATVTHIYRADSDADEEPDYSD